MLFQTELDTLEEVNSSNISLVGTKGHYLVVEFRKGGVYRYPNMSHHLVDLLTAKSIGGYFAKHIRKQECEKIDESFVWEDG